VHLQELCQHDIDDRVCSLVQSAVLRVGREARGRHQLCVGQEEEWAELGQLGWAEGMYLVWGSVIQGGCIGAQEGEVVGGSAIEGGFLGTEQA
jgi:hypothetical protein